MHVRITPLLGWTSSSSLGLSGSAISVGIDSIACNTGSVGWRVSFSCIDVGASTGSTANNCICWTCGDRLPHTICVFTVLFDLQSGE